MSKQRLSRALQTSSYYFSYVLEIATPLHTVGMITVKTSSDSYLPVCMPLYSFLPHWLWVWSCDLCCQWDISKCDATQGLITAYTMKFVFLGNPTDEDTIREPSARANNLNKLPGTWGHLASLRALSPPVRHSGGQLTN